MNLKKREKMMEKENNNVVYKITNNKNDKVYIGITTDSINRRKSDQLSKAKNGYPGKLYNAIATYGAECFNWEQIDTAISKDELAQKEKNYILKFNAKEEGFNSDSGGGIQKKIYHYTIKGEYTGVFGSLAEASDYFDIPKKKVSKICNSATHKFKLGYLSYDMKKDFGDKRTKKVCQYSLEGDLMATFNSIAEASRITGVNKTSIAKVCRGSRKKAGNFLWKFD